MKTLLATTLSFLLLALTTKPLLGASYSEPLIDYYGNKVESTLDYYICENVHGGSGSGMGLYNRSNRDYRLDVIQFEFTAGQKIRFSPASNSIIVQESTDLNVIFPAVLDLCDKKLLWKVDDYDTSFAKWFITTTCEGGGQPGGKTLQNWFKLVPVDENDKSLYKIVHCPSVCDTCAKLCNNVGVFNVDGFQRLVLVPDHEQALHVKLFSARERSIPSM